MIDASFLDGLARFNLIVKKRVTSNYSGPRKSISVGRGMLFKDHRVYAPGDDFRTIDWKVYARTDDLMIKNFEEERNLVVHVLVDGSLSMKYGKKFDYASMLGVGYAYLAMKNNDKIQFSTFSDDVEVFQGQRGMSQVLTMIDYLNKIKMRGKTNLLKVAQHYRKFIGSRALIVIISDFLVDFDNIKEALYYFAGQEVQLIQVLDPKEKLPSMEGDFKLQDSETSEILRSHLSPKAISEYTERMGLHTAKIKRECDNLGINFEQIVSDTPIFDAFYRVLA